MSKIPFEDNSIRFTNTDPTQSWLRWYDRIYILSSMAKSIRVENASMECDSTKYLVCIKLFESKIIWD